MSVLYAVNLNAANHHQVTNVCVDGAAEQNNGIVGECEE